MSSASSGFALLEHKTQTPIANLGPDLPNQNTRAVTGEVTLVWPYNTATKSLAFLLTDPDARRRREKGQVRVQLQGPSAKAVADLRLGGGDTVAIDLDGVEWVKDNSVVGVPGSRVDWQLQFVEKLTLQARIGDQQALKEVKVNEADHDHDIPVQTAQTTIPRVEEPRMTAAPAAATATGKPDTAANGGPEIPIFNQIMMELDEYPSPAFMKRARLSYGALFEDPEAKFEDDGGIKGRGRKRTRFGRDSSSWRYASKSPSPSPEAGSKTLPQTSEAAVEANIELPTPSKPQMADESSQTIEFETDPAHINRAVAQIAASVESQKGLPASPAKDRPSDPSEPPSAQLTDGRHADDLSRKSPVPKPAGAQTAPETAKAAAPPSRFGSNTLFGNYAPSHSGYDKPRFGSTPRRETGSGLGLADQVRFGFSHTPQTPQTDYPQQQPQQMSHSAPAPRRVGHDYPESHLQPPDPSKYADMESYVDQAEQEMEAEPQYAYDGQDLNPPVSESFAGGQFDMAAQSQGYNPIEGGHFGADALDEGIRITTDGYTIHNDEIDVDKVPPGFASFGGGLENEVMEDEEEEEEEEEEPHVPGEDFVENDEVEDDLDDEVALEDRDMTEYGPEGEILEQGDYDQRVYNIPEEDQDELSEEEHQNELQAMAQDNDPDVVDEDELYDDRMDDNEGYDEEAEEGEGEESDGLEDDQGSYDEEEEGFDEEDDDQGSLEDDEGSSDGSYSQGEDASYPTTTRRWVPKAAAPTRVPKEPEVIDLLSDSDDDDEVPTNQPDPAPSKSTESSAVESPRLAGQSVAAPSVTAPSEPQPKQDQTPTRQNLSAGDQHDAVLEPSPGPEQRLSTQERGRRKSSGSHLYGENVDPPVDDSNMDLHLPSTPPPDVQQSAGSRDTNKQEQEPSHAAIEHDVAVVDDEDEADATSSVPGFNGAVESRQVSKGSKTQHVAGGQRGENDAGETRSSVPPARLDEQQTEGKTSLEPSNDAGIPTQIVDASEDQDMADAVTRLVSSQPGSVEDAGRIDAPAHSLDVSKRGVAEVKRLFEEVELPKEDATTAKAGIADTAPLHGPPQQTTPRLMQGVEERDEQKTPGSPLPEVQEDSGENNALFQMPSSSPPHSQSFASQVITSSPLRGDGDLAHAPTPIAAVASPQESTDARVVSTEALVETRIHVEQQVHMTTSENEGAMTTADIEMTDTPAENGAPSSAADQAATCGELDGMDDDEDQIQAQLQYELVHTAVQATGDGVTVIREAKRVSVSHKDSASVSAAQATIMPAQEPDEDVPMEPASLEQAIQEELILQEQVDHEIASQVGEEDNTAQVPEVEGLDGVDDVDDDDEMDDYEAELDSVIAEDAAAEEAGEVAEVSHAKDEPTAPQITAEKIPEDEPDTDGPREKKTSVETNRQDATPQLQGDETVKSTIAVVPEEQPQEALAEEPDCQQESTIAALPYDEEEEVVIIGGDNALQPSETHDTQGGPVDTTPVDPKQEFGVVARPQTRSRRARDHQSQSDEAASHEDTSVRNTTKDVSPEASKTLKRAPGGTKRSTRSKETRDPSIELAIASIQKRGAGKRKTEEAKLEPRRTRKRSASAQPAVPEQDEVEDEEGEQEDSSVALAKATLESPSRKQLEHASSDPAASRADLVRRLRTMLSEFMPLKALRHHKKGNPHVLAVVACDPPEPQRTKHRDYHTTVTVTDASVAPDQVVEVQFMEQHKVYLPAVRQGDTMVLRDFNVVWLPDKQFALKQVDEKSSWAVYDADYEVPGGRGGPLFEMQEAVKDYLHDLRAWYNDLGVEDREKLVTALMKLAEVEGSTG